ncbi:acyl-CoA thioesterase domain-containing protein [Gordonia malaquae]|uniref:acyl-CoA thioesterase domain-containing protein n=1 Tax=Gordonia malaquae TaxID=410332 RepID=UPI0030C795FC
MAARSAFFTSADDTSSHTRFTPGARAASGWGADHMRGMAVSGALARTAERVVEHRGRTDLIPVRWSIDLFRPTRMQDVDVTATIVREGRRFCLVDVVAEQNGSATARGTAAFAAPSESTSRVWTADDAVAPPDSDGDDQPGDVERFYWDEGRGWLTPGTSPYTSARKAVWHFPIPIVDGEPPSPFSITAAVADVVNAIASVGPDGLAFINTDATVHLSRRPSAGSVGLAMTTRTEHAGLSAATAVVFDRHGAFGQVAASGLANPPIALLHHPFPAEGDVR